MQGVCMLIQEFTQPLKCSLIHPSSTLLVFHLHSSTEAKKSQSQILGRDEEILLLLISVSNSFHGHDISVDIMTSEFYLILDVAAGGTNGWFPDGVGKKPWLDGSSTAMFEFANSTDTWYATWPKDVTRRALAV